MERLLSVDLRHNALQMALYGELVAEFGHGRVAAEQPAPGGGRIDLVVQTGAARTLYEIKTASSARGCVREALGQLLDYACWPGRPPVERVVVAGAAPATAVVNFYLDRLNEKFPVPLAYRQVVLHGT